MKADRATTTGETTRTPLALPILLAAAALSLFQLWQSAFGTLGATWLRPIHLTWILVLAFAGPGAASRARRGLDLGFAAAALVAGLMVIRFDRQSITHILEGLAPADLAAAAVLTALVLEAARRRVGAAMTAVALAFLAYNALGASLPGMLAHRGFELERILRFQVFTGAGLFGLPLGVASSTVFVFVLFGALLEATGAGRFFMNLAFSVAGRFRGGPAKAAVLSSAAIGSVSGSAIANTVTTGAITIPMMKRLGYSRAESAGIEAAASTGGQLMPPIMGAGAFLMAELTNTPYPRIVLVSVLPALLFFAGALLFTHGLTVRRGVPATGDRPRIRTALGGGAHFLVAVAVVVVLLWRDYSPPLVGAAGCLAVVLASQARRATRIGPRRLLDALARGAITAVPVSLACAAAGIVVGVIGQTGIGLQFGEAVLSAAHGLLLPALMLSAAAALVLGMGLPVTAAYIVVAVVAAPALTTLGLPLLTAHLVLFWLSQTSNVTPPIALAAFAGAGIAGARPMDAALQAVRLSLGLFLVPLLMAFTPLLPAAGEAPGLAQLVAFLGGVLLFVALAVALYGHGVRPAGRLARGVLLVGALLLLFPSGAARIAGAVLALAGLAPQMRRGNGSSTGASPSTDTGAR